MRELEDAHTEKIEEVERERQARQETENALQVERQGRIRAQNTLQGISPVVVPSLLEALVRVAQLTDKVLH